MPNKQNVSLPPTWAIILVIVVLVLAIASTHFLSTGGSEIASKAKNEFWPLSKNILEQLQRELDDDVKESLVQVYIRGKKGGDGEETKCGRVGERESNGLQLLTNFIIDI